SLEGDYAVNPKFGKQFVVQGAEREQVSTPEAIARYLGSGVIRGIGPAISGRIVKKFGGRTLEVLEFSPHRLAEIKGISKLKAAEIGHLYKETRQIQDNILFFQKYDISVNLALRIVKAYGDGAQAAFLKNPYRLVEDVDGVGFLTADRIALKSGIPENSPLRLRAATLHTLETAANQSGHTYLPLPILRKTVYGFLRAEEDEGAFEDMLGEMLLDGVLKRQTDEEGTARVSTAPCWRAEHGAAARLTRLKREFGGAAIDAAPLIAEFEKLNGIQLAGKQREAVENCVAEGVSVVTGGPGTGKTTIVKCILYVLDALGGTTALCAPTGRAAKRLSHASGREAKTIHRLLESEFKNGRGAYFSRNENNPLDEGTVVADEISMIDAYLAGALLRALRPGSRLILVGDKDQLPSVGPGNILADILQSGLIPAVSLDVVYRQAESSRIVVNAHRINKGQMPELSAGGDFFFSARESGEAIADTVIEMYCRRIPGYLKIAEAEIPLKIQILAPMKNGACGVDAFNRRIRERINPAAPGKRETGFEETRFRTGDKVMQIANNYDKEWHAQNETGAGVFNGDSGVIADIQDDEVLVKFEDGRFARYGASELHQLVLAYAVTIHKSQGSEFDVVIIPITAGNYMILTRNLLYTAVTRAKSMAVLVGSSENVARMVRNNFTAARYTNLKRMLLDEDRKASLFDAAGT
ncbi:MAG: ATP-dependent RecD-like DNA helicase, partial [Clostridiales bacterium]|nr:ATP-dependent RecD-like DNA helicase [Clostridiales bacterium]